MGIDNGLASKYTSFVGVDKKSGKTLTEKPMSTREIKNQVPSGFGMNFGGGFGGGMQRCSGAVQRSGCSSPGKFGSHML